MKAQQIRENYNSKKEKMGCQSQNEKKTWWIETDRIETKSSVNMMEHKEMNFMKMHL